MGVTAAAVLTAPRRRAFSIKRHWDDRTLGLRSRGRAGVLHGALIYMHVLKIAAGSIASPLMRLP